MRLRRGAAIRLRIATVNAVKASRVFVQHDGRCFVC